MPSSALKKTTPISATLYDVTMCSVNGDGTIRLDLKFFCTLIPHPPTSPLFPYTTLFRSYTIDNTAPTVTSIDRHTPSGQNTNATSVTYRVTFSESVASADSTDFTLTETGTAVGTIGTTTPVSGTVYDVTVSSVSGDGTLRLDLKSTGTGIADAATNPVSGGFTSGQTYTIDNTAPTVTSIDRHTPSGQNTNATSVTYRVTFSE